VNIGCAALASCVFPPSNIGNYVFLGQEKCLYVSRKSYNSLTYSLKQDKLTRIVITFNVHRWWVMRGFLTQPFLKICCIGIVWEMPPLLQNRVYLLFARKSMLLICVWHCKIHVSWSSWDTKSHREQRIGPVLCC
jgi:hypothetical protein